MRKILVTAGGTATAWHLAQVAHQYFKDDIEIYLCDTNPSYLVPAATIAKRTFEVPSVVDPKYTMSIEKIIHENRINSIIPLIPQEAYDFACDSDFCIRNGIVSSAPNMKTTELLADKKNMFLALSEIGIPTPRIYSQCEIDEKATYIMKPRLGFGSSGITIIGGEEILDKKIEDGYIIQEYCNNADYEEVTVEVYNGEGCFHFYSRRRVTTKAGVCVKMEPINNDLFKNYVVKLKKAICCPVVFNIQFLRHQGQWKLFDCNLRLGAGTALSSAVGFQLARALLAEMSGIEVKESWFNVDSSVKAVLRVYKEIIVR